MWLLECSVWYPWYCHVVAKCSEWLLVCFYVVARVFCLVSRELPCGCQGVPSIRRYVTMLLLSVLYVC